MNFRPELALLVANGSKTVTRRVVSDNPRSPWFRDACGLKPGSDYAVCPGRGKPAIARVRIVECRLERLGHLTAREAQREGFLSPTHFEEAFAEINGSYDPNQDVWRVELARASS